MQSDIESLTQMHQTLKKIYKSQYFFEKHSLGKGSGGFRCLSQIITEGEWEYFVVQYAANGNKTNVASIWRTLLLIYVRNFQGSKRRVQCLLNRVWEILVAKTNLIPKKKEKKKEKKERCLWTACCKLFSVGLWTLCIFEQAICTAFCTCPAYRSVFSLFFIALTVERQKTTYKNSNM